MAHPDDEEKPFVVRWNRLVSALMIESSVKAVARTAMDFAGSYDGTSCRPSVERIARETGYDERTVRNAWALLRALGMAEGVSRGIPHERKADEYELCIPDCWQNYAVLGPNSRKFTCLNCQRLFNPPAIGFLTDDGTTRWRLPRACFCKPPRKKNGRDADDCFSAWERERVINEDPTWGELGNSGCWRLFREARSDDW